jgi:hypothetical protein
LTPFRRACAKPAAGIMTATSAATVNHFMNLIIIDPPWPAASSGGLKVNAL